MSTTTTWADVVSKLKNVPVVKPTHWSEANQQGGRQVNGTDFILGKSTYGDNNENLYIKLPNSNAYYQGVDYVKMPASKLPYYSGFVGNVATRYGYTNEYGGKNDFYMFVPANGYYTTERYFHLDIYKTFGKFIWLVLQSVNLVLTSSSAKYPFKMMGDAGIINAYWLTVYYPSDVQVVTIGANWQTKGATTGNANWYAMAPSGCCYDLSTGDSQYPLWGTYGPGSTRAPGISQNGTYGSQWMMKSPFYLPVGKPNTQFDVYITYAKYLDS